MKRLRAASALFAAAGLVASAGPAMAASHLWVVNEVFSNADGTVQFIEMHNPTSAANETVLSTRWVRATAQGNQFNFPADLPTGSTAFGYLLLATQGFAGLPGAPAPDYLIPDQFFDPAQDDVEYWLYVVGDLAFGAGQLPIDGVTSLNRDLTTGVNSPTNFAGQSGSVDLSAVSAPQIGAETGVDLRLRVLSMGGSFRIEFDLPQPTAAAVEIRDVSGRAVRRLFEATASGTVRVSWDGRNETGNPVGSGVYFVALEAAGMIAVEKATVVR